jgi:signal transduction histidine kinase
LEGSETFLSEAIENLIDNALVYGCPNGKKIDVEIILGNTVPTLMFKTMVWVLALS